MRNILLILSVLIGLNSFAQDDFFWSYTKPQQYDTLKITTDALQTIYLNGIYHTYSGDSLTVKTPRGSIKIPSNKESSQFSQYIYNEEIGYIISKHNDLYWIHTLVGTLYDLSQLRTLKVFGNDISSSGKIKYNSFISSKVLEEIHLQENFFIPDGISELDLSNNNFLKIIRIVRTTISSLLLPTSYDLADINIIENQGLSSITFGELSPTIWRFYAYNSHFDQANIDKILKYFVDSNRVPFDLGTYGTDVINLCGANNGYPSATGYGYVSTLTSRGWFVCVNNNTTTPIVSTNDPTMVSSTSATLGGNASSDGGAAITARGVSYGTSVNPTISGSHTTLGTGIGLFSSSVTGLSSSTLYHARAYATNANGTSYGTDKTFTTTAAVQTVPELITTAPTAITTTTASSGGIITFDGNYEIIEKGVCWSTSPSPNTSNSKTNNGNGTDSYTSSITGLSPNTTYYLRAYATNRRDAGGSYVYATGYGQEEVFMTASSSECNLPTVTTNAVNSITTNSAIGGGNITSDGNCEVTIKGVCWSTAMNPTTANSHTTDGSGTGSFSSSITGLACGFTYYVRAYATNNSGTAYGNQISFTTSNIIANLSGYTANPSYPVSIGGYWRVTLSSPAPSLVSIPITITSGNNSGTTNYNVSISVGETIGEISVNYYFKTTDWTAYAIFGSMPTGYTAGTNANITIPAYNPTVGDAVAGGVVAYIFQSGDSGFISGESHGFIAAPTDQSSGIVWGINSNTVSTSLAIGSSSTNCANIISVNGSGTYAAKYCSDLSLNGYSDWWLPSYYELQIMCSNKALIGGFTNGNYWSSTQSVSSTSQAYIWNFGSTCVDGDAVKGYSGLVRAIRYF